MGSGKWEKIEILRFFDVLLSVVRFGGCGEERESHREDAEAPVFYRVVCIPFFPRINPGVSLMGDLKTSHA